MLARALNRLRRDTRGSTIVEFAIIAPSFMILLMGVFDLGQAVYLRAVMNGAMQEAARAGANVFDVLLDAVKVCSLGQITSALFEVGGQYRRNM